MAGAGSAPAAVIAGSAPQRRTPSAASAPARFEPRASCRARSKASTAPTAAAQRTSATHSQGAASPSGASSAQTATGSGLNAGPSAVLRLPPAISRPHSSHAHGSYDGAGATTSMLARASPTAMSSARFTAGS